MRNFTAIGQTVVEIWRFFDFTDGGRPPSRILKGRNFKSGKDDKGQSVPAFTFRGDRSNPCWDMAIFRLHPFGT